MQALIKQRSKVKVKCFNCGKTGNIQRNCKAPRKRVRSVSPQRHNQGHSNQASRESWLSMEGVLPLASEDSTVNLIVPKSNINVTTYGYIDGKKRNLTIYTGAGFSIIRPDLVMGAVEPLSGVSLRTASGELATVYGKTRVVLRIGKIVTFHEFLVADIEDEVLIGVDVMIRQNISLDVGKQIMYLGDDEIPLDVGFESEARRGQLYASNCPELSPHYLYRVIWRYLPCSRKILTNLVSSCLAVVICPDMSEEWPVSFSNKTTTKGRNFCQTTDTLEWTA